MKNTIDANDHLNNFEYEAFMAREFPKPEGAYPDIERLLGHFDKITRLLMECALQSLRVAEGNQNESARHANTRYIIVCNFRLRTLNLIKVFGELLDLNGGSLFDEGTANIIARSLLESYLVYYRLYNGCGGDKETQELYFNLYDLSSVLHFLKHGKWLKTQGQVNINEGNLTLQINELINDIKRHSQFGTLPVGIQEAIKKIEKGKLDYLSFMSFNKLIKDSPLPTDFITNFYSYSSSFAHAEGFSSILSQSYFESRVKWKALNERSKFKLIYVCLAVSAQFFISYIEYDRTQLEDDRAKDVWETVSLCNYYLTALNLNK